MQHSGMKLAVRTVVTTFALAFGIAVAQAQTFMSTLSGPAENPPNASGGNGSTIVTVDQLSHTLRVQATFSGLQGNTTASHLHCCVAPPGAAGVATTTPTFVGFPLGVQSGTFDQTYNTLSAGTYNPAFVTSNGGTVAGAEAALFSGILAGQAYLNIHTTTFPGGEIRGFLLPAPLGIGIPTLAQGLIGVLSLMLAAGGWLAWRRRRVGAPG